MESGAARLIGLVLAVLVWAVPACAETGFGGEGLSFQLVAYPGDLSTALFLAEAETNLPVEGASIEVDDGVWRGVARPTASPGIYELAWKPPPHGADLVVTITAQGRDDFILVRGVDAGEDGDSGTSWVLILGGGLLLLTGFAIKRRMPVTVTLALTLLGGAGDALAHGEDSHASQFPAGQPVIMDKPTQFHLELRTQKPGLGWSFSGNLLSVIPAHALFDLSGHQVVFVRLGPETFEARHVTVERSENGQAFLSEGLGFNDRVVVQGGEHLQAVEVVPHRFVSTEGSWYGGQVNLLPEGGRAEIAVRDGVIQFWLRDAADRVLEVEGMALIRHGGKTETVTIKDGLAEAPVKASERLTVILRLKQARRLLTARFAQAGLVTPVLSSDAASGKAAFDGICAKCHGAALRGSDKGPPLLHPLYAPGSGHGDSLILAAMTHGATAHMWKFGDMPKPEGLEPGQDKQVLSYIRAMQAANGLGDGSGQGSDVCTVPLN